MVGGDWAVEIGNGDKIRVRPENLQSIDYLHPILLTPTALYNPANLWCLPPGQLWWSNAMLDLLPAFYLASEECSRAGVQGGLAFKPPTLPSNRAGLPIADSAGP
jgi:hypothetical protein